MLVFSYFERFSASFRPVRQRFIKMQDIPGMGARRPVHIYIANDDKMHNKAVWSVLYLYAVLLPESHRKVPAIKVFHPLNCTKNEFNLLGRSLYEFRTSEYLQWTEINEYETVEIRGIRECPVESKGDYNQLSENDTPRGEFDMQISFTFILSCSCGTWFRNGCIKSLIKNN